MPPVPAQAEAPRPLCVRLDEEALLKERSLESTCDLSGPVGFVQHDLVAQELGDGGGCEGRPSGGVRACVILEAG
eukprot:482634-Alexandrium_andersonii.AAC.1